MMWTNHAPRIDVKSAVASAWDLVYIQVIPASHDKHDHGYDSAHNTHVLSTY